MFDEFEDCIKTCIPKTARTEVRVMMENTRVFLDDACVYTHTNTLVRKRVFEMREWRTESQVCIYVLIRRRLLFLESIDIQDKCIETAAKRHTRVKIVSVT